MADSTASRLKKVITEHGTMSSVLRIIIGSVFLILWAAFLVGEFFGFVQHPEEFNLEHSLTKWSPLFVGLALLAPEVLDKVVGLPALLKGITKKGD